MPARPRGGLDVRLCARARAYFSFLLPPPATSADPPTPSARPFAAPPFPARRAGASQRNEGDAYARRAPLPPPSPPPRPVTRSGGIENNNKRRRHGGRNKKKRKKKRKEKKKERKKEGEKKREEKRKEGDGKKTRRKNARYFLIQDPVAARDMQISRRCPAPLPLFSRVSVGQLCRSCFLRRALSLSLSHSLSLSLSLSLFYFSSPFFSSFFLRARARPRRRWSRC